MNSQFAWMIALAIAVVFGMAARWTKSELLGVTCVMFCVIAGIVCGMLYVQAFYLTVTPMPVRMLT